jgi:hypothetical protein
MCSIWTQICRTTSKSWQLHFQQYLDDFENAGENSAIEPGAQMTLENYITWSRRASGFIMGLALIEYVEGLKLPDDVFKSPIITKLRQDALDIVIWMHVRIRFCRYHFTTHMRAFIGYRVI